MLQVLDASFPALGVISGGEFLVAKLTESFIIAKVIDHSTTDSSLLRQPLFKIDQGPGAGELWSRKRTLNSELGTLGTSTRYRSIA